MGVAYETISCCSAKMAAKCIFLTSVFALLEAGPTVYWHLRNNESVGAGPSAKESKIIELTRHILITTRDT